MPSNTGGDQYDPEYRPEQPKPVANSLGGHIFENLQRARKELRHQAHVYANTKNREKRDAAGEELDKAALMLALAASTQGLYSDCARPAGKKGIEWQRANDPDVPPPRASKRTKRKSP